MKRFLSAALVVCFLIVSPIAFPLVAQADVLFEPEGAFFAINQDKMQYISRGFVASGKDGRVSMYASPRGNRQAGVRSIENGTTVFVYWVCLYNNEYWGYVTDAGEGWVRMDELRVVYDAVSFAQEHADEITETTRDYSFIREAPVIILWTYPGSGIIQWEFENNPDYAQSAIGEISRVYTDPDGREWGNIGYFLGSRNVWVCLSDIGNPDIPAFNPAPEPMVWVPDTVYENIPGGLFDGLSGVDRTAIIIVIVSVVVVVAGTVVLIVVLGRRKGK